MNQVQRILKSNAPIHSVAGSTYKGAAPVYTDASKPSDPPRFIKTSTGIPFVKVIRT
jgi:hypothetical protein